MADSGAASGPAGAPIDLSRSQQIHIIGIGGSGMSAIAVVLAGMGHQVSGSDLDPSGASALLAGAGVEVATGHDAANVPADVDIVTRSTAVPDSNVEVVEAHARHVDVLSRSTVLAAIAGTRATVAVAGTHGKTTTSSMLALVLMEAGMRPSFIIGGEVTSVGTGAAWDTGELFVIEADESDGTFLTLPRSAAIVTNVEADHLEYWGGNDALEAAFRRFLSETDGPRIVCADDANASRLARGLDVITYGTDPGADYLLAAWKPAREGSTFELWHGGELLGEVRVPVAGVHNARNACAAIVTGLAVGATFEAGSEAIARFGGVARRYQPRGTANGITFIDDYAHLPTEIAAALSAASDGAWGRVVCVFQPHRFSRTEALWSTFDDCFEAADVLVVTDVYPAGEQPREGVSGALVVRAVLDAHPAKRVVYLPGRSAQVSFLAGELRAGDLCLTLGAGDLTTLPADLLARLGGSDRA